MEREERIDKLRKVRDEIIKEISTAREQHNARGVLDWCTALHEITRRIEDE
jgi:hypothetical protein